MNIKYKTRSFPTEDLIEVVVYAGKVKGYELIDTKFTDLRRWKADYEAIFKYEGKYYMTHYSVGATELQDIQPYEDEGDEVECFEVEPHEVVVTKYRVIEIE